MREQENRWNMDTQENPKKGQQGKEWKSKMQESKFAESKTERSKERNSYSRRRLGYGSSAITDAKHHSQVLSFRRFPSQCLAPLYNYNCILLVFFRSHTWRRLFALLVSCVIHVWIMKVTNFMQFLSVSQFYRKPLQLPSPAPLSKFSTPLHLC